MGIRGGNPPMRPDQALQTLSRAGTGPAPQQNIVFATKVIVSGPNGGEFVYNATRTVLESSNAGAATTDPILGLAVPQGFATYNAFGAVINLLSTSKSAFFQYLDNGSAVQGSLILAVASTSGTDPVDGTAYSAGLTGIDPVFGDSILTLGASINLGQVAYTRTADVLAHTASDNAHQPLLIVDAPQQTTASHLQMLLAGASPDGTTKLAQLIVGIVTGSTILTPSTNAAMELQGSLDLTGNVNAIVASAEEVWHSLPLASGWTQNAGHTAGQYKLLAGPPKAIWLKGDLNHASFSGSSAMTTALPAAYLPTVTKESDFQVDTAGQQPHYTYDTTGVLTINSAGAGTTRVVFNEIFSLES